MALFSGGLSAENQAHIDQPDVLLALVVIDPLGR